MHTEKSGSLITTGSLKDVMKESISVALTLVKLYLTEQHQDRLEAFERADKHIHFPDGATPKDGPSAGGAIALAFLSAALELPIRSDMALTGEISTDGKLLPVGGIKEKLLAAYYNGVYEVALPSSNKGLVEDLSDEVRSKMEFHFVTKFSQLVEIFILKDQESLQEPQAFVEDASQDFGLDDRGEQENQI